METIKRWAEVVMEGVCDGADVVKMSMPMGVGCSEGEEGDRDG